MRLCSITDTAGIPLPYGTGSGYCPKGPDASDLNYNYYYERFAVAARAIRDLVTAYGTAVRWGLVTTSSTTVNICKATCPIPLCGLSSCDPCLPGTVRCRIGTTAMNSALNAYQTAMRAISEPPPITAKKDWDSAFSNADAITGNSVTEEWNRAITADTRKYCRKRATIFVTSGGGGFLGRCIDEVAGKIGSLYTMLGSEYDPIETYVVGFKLDPTEPDYYYLELMAAAGRTDYPRNANSGPDYTSIITDLLNRILAGEYSGSNPILSFDEGNIYQAYFKIYDPASDPEKRAFEGHLLNYELEDNGDVESLPHWDAAVPLVGVPWSERKVYTSYDDGIGDVAALTEFNSTDLSLFLSSLDLNESDVDCDGKTGASHGDAELQEDAAALLAFVRGDVTQKYETSTCTSAITREAYKLLDIYRSTARYVQRPAVQWESTPQFTAFQQEQLHRGHYLVVGSNSGMIHAFHAGTHDVTSDAWEPSELGLERWTYIPQHILPKLKELWQYAHSTLVDATGSVQDVWVGTPSETDAADRKWKTVFIVGDGIQGNEEECKAALLEGSTSKKLWNCGYYTAVDIAVPSITEPEDYTLFGIDPLWEFKGDGDLMATVAPPSFTRIRVPLVDGGSLVPELRYAVILPGRGTSQTDVPNVTACNAPVYFVDPGTGEVFRKVNLPYVTSSGCLEGGIHGVWAQPLAIDTGADQVADVVYVGDVDGQLWRIDLTPTGYTSPIDPDNWTTGVDGSGDPVPVFYPGLDQFSATMSDHIYSYSGPGDGTAALPIAFAPAIGFDNDGNMKIYVGTGDPMTIDEYGETARGHIYALVEDVAAGTVALDLSFNDPEVHTENNIEDGVTRQAGVLTLDEGEVLAGEPLLYSGLVIFTTYVRIRAEDGTCPTGVGRLYAIDWLSGQSQLDDSNHDGAADAYISLGEGIPSGAVLGRNRVYVTMNDGDLEDMVRGFSFEKLTEGLEETLMPYSWIEVTGR